MDLKEFYFQNIKESEYHHRFLNSVKKVNYTYNLFTGEEETQDYQFEIYAEAAKRYRVRAVCGVGMGQTGTQTDSVRKKSGISVDIPLFTLQGNFNVKKLHGIYRPMMEIMVKTAGKSLAAKKDRTPEEDGMLDMMLHGGERVKQENLSAVLDWYHAQQ